MLFQQQEGDAYDVEGNKRRRLHSVAASPAQAAKLVLFYVPSARAGCSLRREHCSDVQRALIGLTLRRVLE